MILDAQNKNLFMNMRILTLLVLSGSLLSSCEKGTDVVCVLENNTSETLNVALHYKYLSTGVEYDTLAPNQTKRVLWLGRQTGGFTDKIVIENVIDSMTGISGSGKQLKSTYHTSADWTKLVLTKKQTIEFHAKIDDSGLE